MKKNLSVIMAFIFGIVITLAVVFVTSDKTDETLKVEHLSGVPAQNAVYTKDVNGKIIPLDFTGATKNVMNAVVNIQSTMAGQESPEYDEFFRYFFGPDQVPEQQERVGIGSGVIINSNGYIITNKHVVEDSKELDVTLRDNRTYKADIVGTDPSTDLALIKIDEKNLPVIAFANSDEAQVGEWVLAIGNPYGLTSTVTAGIISAKSRSLNLSRNQNSIESFIQTDAAINPGNSGGALVNLKGGLVGINTAIASPTGSYSGYGFAVSSNIVSKVAEDLMKFGKVKRAYLGILLHNITGKFARENKLQVNQGAFVDNVIKNGAAARAGIQPGDIIVKVNGIQIRQSSELQEVIAEHHPGDKVNVTVNRKGSTKEFNVVLQGGD